MKEEFNAQLKKRCISVNEMLRSAQNSGGDPLRLLEHMYKETADVKVNRLPVL